MKHEMKLKEIYFNKIKSGEKIYEIRLNDEKRQLIKVEDIIIFSNSNYQSEQISTIVEDLIYFNSFEEMVNQLPAQLIGFENMSKDKILNVYHQFYSIEDEKKYGILAIKIKNL